MKKNLILSILSLITTTFLLLFLAYGWYVSNDIVTANGIFGTSASENYSLTLERAEVDENGNVLSWVKNDELSFSSITPNNVFLFRIGLDSKADNVSLNVKFSEVNSRLTPNKLQVSNGYVSYIDGDVPLYKLVNNEVVIDNKVLYRYDELEEALSLVDYLIHNTFMFYNLGTTEPTNTIIPEGNLGTVLLDVNDFNLTGSKDSLDYFYFALEFNEEKSLAMIDGKESSNCYLYQNLVIGHIEVREN